MSRDLPPHLFFEKYCPELVPYIGDRDSSGLLIHPDKRASVTQEQKEYLYQQKSFTSCSFLEQLCKNKTEEQIKDMLKKNEKYKRGDDWCYMIAADRANIDKLADAEIVLTMRGVLKALQRKYCTQEQRYFQAYFDKHMAITVAKQAKTTHQDVGPPVRPTPASASLNTGAQARVAQLMWQVAELVPPKNRAQAHDFITEALSLLNDDHKSAHDHGTLADASNITRPASQATQRKQLSTNRLPLDTFPCASQASAEDNKNEEETGSKASTTGEEWVEHVLDELPPPSTSSEEASQPHGPSTTSRGTSEDEA